MINVEKQFNDDETHWNFRGDFSFHEQSRCEVKCRRSGFHCARLSLDCRSYAVLLMETTANVHLKCTRLKKKTSSKTNSCASSVTEEESHYFDLFDCFSIEIRTLEPMIVFTRVKSPFDL